MLGEFGDVILMEAEPPCMLSTNKISGRHNQLGPFVKYDVGIRCLSHSGPEWGQMPLDIGRPIACTVFMPWGKHNSDIESVQ